MKRQSLDKFMLFSICIFLSHNPSLFAHENCESLIQKSSNGAYVLNGELSSGQKKLGGGSAGGIFELCDGHKLHVKVGDPVISYLTSRLVRFIAPGQIAKVVVVRQGNKFLTGSVDIPDIKQRTGKEEGTALLNLALDLMAITDRSLGNVVAAPVDGIRKAVAVDVDMHNFGFDWLLYGGTVGAGTGFLSPPHGLGLGQEVVEKRKALAHIAAISEQEVRDVFLKAVKELEAMDVISRGQKSHYTDSILSEVLKRKEQMKWFYENIDAALAALEIPVKQKNHELIRSSLKNDSCGYLLAKVARFAKSSEEIEFVKSLVESGAKEDAKGSALYKFVNANNSEMVKFLFAHGFKNDLGICLSPAIENNNLEIVQLLVEHLTKEDIVDDLLIKAVKVNNIEIARLLIEHGAKDSKGKALQAAQEHANKQSWWNRDLSMVHLLENAQLDLK